jgi:hypothetical protein
VSTAPDTASSPAILAALFVPTPIPSSRSLLYLFHGVNLSLDRLSVCPVLPSPFAVLRGRGRYSFLRVAERRRQTYPDPKEGITLHGLMMAEGGNAEAMLFLATDPEPEEVRRFIREDSERRFRQSRSED